MALQDGGGVVQNQSLNLYHIDQDRFLLVSSRDCVEIDPIKSQLAVCARKQVCRQKHDYVGRFGWMNGFDPPRGRFGYAFRFLPAYDAGADEGC